MKKLAVAIALAAVLVSFCTTEPKSRRVIVLAFDGLDPHVVDLLMSEGRMPSFAKLRREGAYAPLLSAKPLLSPVVWTTIATGKTPDRHRIGDFVAVDQTTGERLPVTSRMRGTKALWNILSEQGRDVAVIGWWATWPAESVRGCIVTDHLAYHFLFDEGLLSTSVSEGTVYPADLAREIAPYITRPRDIGAADLAPYARVSAVELARAIDFDDELSHLRWALAAARTHHDIGLHLWKAKRADDLMVYIEGTDSTAHLFGHLFRATGLSGELAEQQKRYGSTVEQMYVLADRFVGDYMKVMDDRTALVVVSDHGFELGKLQDDPSKTRDMRRVSEQFHRLRGVLYLYGQGIKRHVGLDQPTILDVAPTILALNGLPPAADMPGRVLTEALTYDPKARIATYESGVPAPVAQAPARDPNVDTEMRKRLQSLGYLQPTPEGNRNLAAVLFQQKRYAEAVAAYKKLVDENPEDAALQTSYGGALGAIGDYDRALEHLAKAIALDPIGAEAHHNRAVIHERRGDRAAAIKDYQTALRYQPGYEPAVLALQKLGAPTDPTAPKNESERRAHALAEDAGIAARRGDYATALRKLDEAQRIAPRYALLYQYRSNVAYLLGDREQAIAALRKGLEIEPQNALFRENLKRLEQKPR